MTMQTISYLLTYANTLTFTKRKVDVFVLPHLAVNEVVKRNSDREILCPQRHGPIMQLITAPQGASVYLS